MSISPVGSSPVGISQRLVQTARAASDPFASFFKGNQAVKPGGPDASLAGIAASASGTAPASLPPEKAAALRQQAEAALAEFRRTLKQLFGEHGVDANQEIRLESDGSGGVAVANNHFDAAKIEQIFRDNPDLAAKFQYLDSTFSQLRGAEPVKTGGPNFEPVFGLSFKEDQLSVVFQAAS